MKYLQLNIKAPLQYYSLASHASSVKNDFFKTAIAPTKAAIVGMLGNAMGYSRGSEELRRLYDSIVVKHKTIEESQTHIVDDQIVLARKGESFACAGGGRTKPGVSMQKWVEYLQDAHFLVFIGAEEPLLDILYAALRNPAHALYFGRKCCVPSEPVVRKKIILEEREMPDGFDSF